MDDRAAPNKTYSYPGRDDEPWAASLTDYQGGGLEHAKEAHQQDLLASGWRLRMRGEEEEWTRAVQRRGVEQVGDDLRKFVTRGAAGWLIEALADLLFYPTAEEAWAVNEAALVELGGGKPREKADPLRARFGSTAAALASAAAPLSARALGAGAQSYAVAESRGRTRARWDEIHCHPTHVGGGGIKGLAAVERAVDAQRSVAGAGLTAIELAGLEDWLKEKVKPEERIRRYRRRLAVQRGNRVTWVEVLDDGGSGTTEIASASSSLAIISDAAAREATADMTDRAILALLTRARQQLERHLGRTPARAEALAFEMGDASFLAPVVERRPERERPPPAPRPSRAKQRPSLGASWS
jgi:hypothetical protein